MPITVSFIISMLETLKLIHFFLTEYAGWAFSKEALDPGQSLFIFFHTDEIGREAFGYTSHHDAVIIMFFTGLLVTLPVLYGSTVYATSDFFGAEEDTTAYTSGLLEDPDYVFFYGALLDGALRLDGDTSEHEPVHENSWVGSLDESDAHAFNYDVSYFTLAPYANNTIIPEYFYDETYLGFKNENPDDRLIWMWAYEETGMDREIDVHRFYPYDTEFYGFTDLMSWYYTTTYDPYQDDLIFPYEIEDFEFLFEDLEEEINEDESEVAARDEELFDVESEPNAFFVWEGVNTGLPHMEFLIEEEDRYEPLFDTAPTDLDWEVGDEYEALLNVANPHPALAMSPMFTAVPTWDTVFLEPFDVEVESCRSSLDHYGSFGDLDPLEFSDVSTFLHTGKLNTNLFERETETGFAFGAESLVYEPFSLNEIIMTKDLLFADFEDMILQTSLLIESIVLLQRTDSLPELPVVWNAEKQLYLVMNSANEKLVTVPQVLNTFQLEERFINQELRYFFGMLTPRDFSRRLAEVKVWSSSWVSFFTGLVFKGKDLSFFFESYVPPSELLAVPRLWAVNPSLTLPRSWVGLEILAVPTLLFKVYSRIRKYSISALYFYFSQLFYVWMAFGHYSISAMTTSFVNIFQTIPGYGHIVEHFKISKSVEIWTPFLPGSLEYIEGYRKDFIDIMYHGQDIFAFYDEVVGPVWARLGLSDSNVYEDFWETYDFRNNKANFWFQSLLFQTSPEDVALYPPRYGLENFYLDREIYQPYEVWETESDGWFLERDKSIVERTPRVWSQYELEEPNHHYLKGFEERLKRVRFVIVMKIFEKRFPKDKKRAII